MGLVPDFCHNITLILNETSYQLLSECWTEEQIAEFLRLYLPLIILPISLISNCLSFFVLRSRHMCGTATAFFMLVLSVLDPLLLLAKNLVYFPTSFAAYALLCKTIYFLIYVLGYTNVWILVIMTADKFIAVWFPLKVAYFCTISRAKYVCIFLAATTSIISLHHFWTIDSFKHPKNIDQYACFYNITRYSAIQRVWRYVDFVIWCFLPFILISTLSVLIISKLRRKGSESPQTTERKTTRSVRSPEVENGNHLSIYKSGYLGIEMRSNQRAKVIRSRQRHITVMLLAVAGVFLLLTLPNSIYFVLEITYGFNEKPTANDYHQWLRYRRLKILTVLMYQLSDLQHATNFFIYLLTSGKFRRSLVTICVSIIYCFPALLTCSYERRTNSERLSNRRLDRYQNDLPSRPSASDMSNIIRNSRDASNKQQQPKHFCIYQSL